MAAVLLAMGQSETVRRCRACGEVGAGVVGRCRRCGRPALRLLRADEQRTWAAMQGEPEELRARAVTVRCGMEETERGKR